jgi:hypothetical protein
MENALLSDISPNVRKLLERRGKNLADRSKNTSASEQEAVKAIYIRAVPLLTDFDKNTWAKGENQAQQAQQAQAIRNKYMLRAGNLGENSTVGPPSLEYNPTKRQGKPTAGLTGLTVEQRGLGEGLISVITLKGVIPSINDLEDYLPVLFTPGNYWLLEWGFTKASGTTNLINLHTFFAQRDVQKLYDMVDTHRKLTGENDAVIGCTKTFEYSVNDAGGFEFSIEMLSNATLFKKNIQATTNYTIGYYEAPEVSKEDKAKGFSGETVISKEETGGILKEDVVMPSLIENQSVPLTAAAKAQLKFNTATPRDFFDNLKQYMVRICAGKSYYTEGVQSNVAFVAEEGNPGNLMYWGKGGKKRHKIDTEYDSIRKFGIYYKSILEPIKTTYQIPELGKQIGGTLDKAEKIIYNFDKFDNELGPYCTWGWMEDNILSVAYGMVGSEIGETFKVESTDNNGLPNILNSHESLYTTDPSRFIIPGKTAEIFEKTIQEEGAYAKDTGKGQIGILKKKLDVLDTYHPIVKEYTRLSEAALPFDSNGVISDMYDQREKNVLVKGGQKGSLRRLILHWSVIQEAFSGAASVDIGLKRLYSIIEKEYTGFWKFNQMSTDTKLSTIELNSIQEIDSSTVKTDKEADKGIYTFPSFGRVSGSFGIHDPLVISQQLSVTIPDSAALAMMFANNKSGQEALANSNFGNNIDNQLITVLTQEEKANSKVSVMPTFQRGEIRIAGHIREDGVAVRTKKISPGELFSLSKLAKHPLEKAYEGIGTFISDGWSTTKKVAGEVGDQLGKIQFESKKSTTDPIQMTFKFGMAIDANGRMYPGYHSRMLFYLNNQVYVTAGTAEKLVSGKTTRLLEPVKLTFKVLGVSGLNWGNKFNISYIPKKYREQTCFSISSITHNISDNKWTTDITGTMRYLPTKEVLVNKLSLDPKLLGPIEDSLSRADTEFFNKLADTFGDKIPAVLGGAMSRFKVMTEKEAREEEENARLEAVQAEG